MTYNVKQAEDILKISQPWIYTKARRLGIKKQSGQYYFTDHDIKKIKQLEKKPYKRSSKAEQIARKTGLKTSQVVGLADKLKLRFRKQSKEIQYIAKFWKTGFYTYKGLRNLLKDFK